MTRERRVCKECLAEGIGTYRDAPYPGPRCDTHRRSALKARKAKNHSTRVQKVYGLAEGEYDLLYAAQGGRCAILRCRARGVAKRLAVDHDHKLEGRDAVRGLLCGPHNRAIGDNGDDPEVFEALAAYLRNPPARAVLSPAPIGVDEVMAAFGPGSHRASVDPAEVITFCGLTRTDLAVPGFVAECSDQCTAEGCAP